MPSTELVIEVALHLDAADADVDLAEAAAHRALRGVLSRLESDLGIVARSGGVGVAPFTTDATTLNGVFEAAVAARLPTAPTLYSLVLTDRTGPERRVGVSRPLERVVAARWFGPHATAEQSADTESTVMHELGHALGAWHVRDPTSVMSGQLTDEPGSGTVWDAASLEAITLSAAFRSRPLLDAAKRPEVERLQTLYAATRAADAAFPLAQALRNEGLIRAASGDYDGAIVRLRAAIDLEPHLPRAHWDLGVACEYAGQIGDAREAYAAVPADDVSADEAVARLALIRDWMGE